MNKQTAIITIDQTLELLCAVTVHHDERAGVLFLRPTENLASSGAGS